MMMDAGWFEIDDLVYLYNAEGVQPSTKIASFDMDHTLITTKTGDVWPEHKDDWKFFYDWVPERLRSLHAEGFKLVIFTNQAGIAWDVTEAKEIHDKIESVISEVGVPMQAMIAGCEGGVYRKPLPGMWTYITTKANGNVVVDLKSSVYVGDAAGRVANWKPGKETDFACSDRLFALNAGVRFATPEAYFNGEKEGEYIIPKSHNHMH